jgi:ferredoxin
VNNVETLYNVSLAERGTPVTEKFLSVCGAVKAPKSLSVPVGMTFRDLIAAADGATVSDFGIFVSGIMMGTLTFDQDDVVTKTTGGLILLPRDHYLMTRRTRSQQEMNHIGKSACDQCSYCTEFCPRYLLGYEVQPHKVMRSLGFTATGSNIWNQWSELCCACGLRVAWRLCKAKRGRSGRASDRRQGNAGEEGGDSQPAARVAQRNDLNLRFGRRVPVLVGLTVFDAPHVKPSGGVGVALRIFAVGCGYHCDQISIGSHGHYRGHELVATCGLGAASEKLHHVVPPRGHLRIVLDVLGREPFVGLIPVVALQEVFLDVIGDLLEGIHLAIFVFE